MARNRRSAQRWLARPATVLIVSMVVGCSGSASGFYVFHGATASRATIPVPQRRPAQPGSVELLDGTRLAVPGPAGHITLINFWATWCPPCVVEAPQLDVVARKYRGQVQIVGVATKDSSRATVRVFVHDNQLTYPIAWDEPGQLMSTLGRLPATGLPVSVIVDRHARVAAIYLPPLRPPDLEPVLDQLLAEH